MFVGKKMDASGLLGSTLDVEVARAAESIAESGAAGTRFRELLDAFEHWSTRSWECDCGGEARSFVAAKALARALSSAPDMQGESAARLTSRFKDIFRNTTCVDGVELAASIATTLGAYGDAAQCAVPALRKALGFFGTHPDHPAAIEIAAALARIDPTQSSESAHQSVLFQPVSEALRTLVRSFAK